MGVLYSKTDLRIERASEERAKNSEERKRQATSTNNLHCGLIFSFFSFPFDTSFQGPNVALLSSSSIVQCSVCLLFFTRSPGHSGHCPHCPTAAFSASSSSSSLPLLLLDAASSSLSLALSLSLVQLKVAGERAGKRLSLEQLSKLVHV